MASHLLDSASKVSKSNSFSGEIKWGGKRKVTTSKPSLNLFEQA